MKNIILGSVLAVVAVAAFNANAAESTFCNNPNVATNGATAATAGIDFVKVAFTPKCSANVFLVGDDESALLFRVGSASSKGKSFFGGSSVGGAVARNNDCQGTNGACRLQDAQAGRSGAPSS